MHNKCKLLVVFVSGILCFFLEFTNVANANGCGGGYRYYQVGPSVDDNGHETEYIDIQEITLDITNLRDDYKIIGFPDFTSTTSGGVNLKTLDTNQDGFSDKNFWIRDGNKIIWKPDGKSRRIYQQGCSTGGALDINCAYAIIAFQRNLDQSEGSVIMPGHAKGTYPSGKSFERSFTLSHSYSDCPKSGSSLTEESILPSSDAISLAQKNRRLALLIGNANYTYAGSLPNPVNDAQAIANVLQRLGFEVIQHENLDQSAMKRAIDDFGKQLQHYDIGLFFYSGHGVQVNGGNYLIPIDANPGSEKEVEYECVNAGRILAEMETANNPMNIMILDACREDPFEKSWTRSLSNKGLAVMNAPTGSLIAYATAPGKIAYDDAGKQNSPYTSALLKYIEIPNISILEMFQRVRTLVIGDTNGNQTPWESTSLTDNFYFTQQDTTLPQFSHQLGLLQTYSGECIGGSWRDEKCPVGSNEQIVLSLEKPAFIEHIEFYADDKIGQNYEAKVSVLVDNNPITENIDIEEDGKLYSIQVGRNGTEIKIKAVVFDETYIHWVKVYGKW